MEYVNQIKPGRWHHFKGQDYEVLFTARHSETEEPMVVYRTLYGERGLWVRPASMWRESVERSGVCMNRFTYTGDMDILLRPERPDDYRQSENVTREAFWNLMTPGCDEHYLLHTMRDDANFVPELDFVAEKDDRIIGNIVYAKSSITDHEGIRHEALTFGPVSVLPEFQRSGIGARLIFHTLDLARELGYRAVIIFGHPDYYPRFGFKRARDFGLTASNGKAPDAFMALELVPGSLKEIGGGVFHEADIYHVDEQAADAFDKTFRHKEKKAPEKGI